MTRAALAAVALALSGPAQATPVDETGKAWVGMLERCLSEVTENRRLPGIGAGWRFGRHDENEPTYRILSFEHRDTGMIAVIRQRLPDRQVQSCGTSIWRHFPGTEVAAATEAWASEEIAAGRLTDTGRGDGMGRDGPMPGQIWTYRWCGPKGAATLRFDMSDFPPASMDVFRAESCAVGG